MLLLLLEVLVISARPLNADLGGRRLFLLLLLPPLPPRCGTANALLLPLLWRLPVARRRVGLLRGGA